MDRWTRCPNCEALFTIEPLRCPIRQRVYAWHCTTCNHKWLAL